MCNGLWLYLKITTSPHLDNLQTKLYSSFNLCPWLMASVSGTLVSLLQPLFCSMSSCRNIAKLSIIFPDEVLKEMLSLLPISMIGSVQENSNILKYVGISNSTCLTYIQCLLAVTHCLFAVYKMNLWSQFSSLQTDLCLWNSCSSCCSPY